MFKFLASIFSFLLMANEGSGGGITIDPGQAIESLRQNNAVVGILYAIVLIEATVIVILWRKLNELHKERIEDLKARVSAEEDLRKEIQEIYTKLNTERNK